MSLKEAKTDSFYCESIAKSISEIIRFSLDEEFRKSCFKLFNVSSTNETEKEINKRLLSIIENKNATLLKPRKRRKKLSEEDKENLDKEVQTDPKDIDQSKSKIPENFFKKNWLQISSQQYREAVKRRRLNYFSQPQYSHEGDVENSKCDLRLSNSQPSYSNYSLYEEVGESSSQVFDSISICQRMLGSSFPKSNSKF